MTMESLIETCTQLGIRLALAGDNDDRLKVDAPKGALSIALRDSLTTHKSELIAFLRAQRIANERDDEIETEIPLRPAITAESPAPATRSPHLAEAKPLIEELSLSSTSADSNRTDVEIRKLLAGGDYDVSVIDPKDPAARKIIATELLTALSGRNYDHHEPARRAFMGHGYFDDATKQLRTADSPAERAVAARKLGVVRDSIASPHLIGALSDNAPEVRRASVESLGQIGDPSAVESLNELLLTETSRQLPEAVIRHAINSIKVTEAKNAPVKQKPALHIVEKPVAKPELQTPKREIFSEYLNAFEQKEKDAPLVVTPQAPVPQATNISLESAEERLLREEEALRKAADALERKRLEAQALRKKAEDGARMTVGAEVQGRLEIEARIRVEEEARRRAEEAARQTLLEETRLRSEEARGGAEGEARRRAEEEAQFRLEAETLRKAAEELARKRAEAEVARKLAEIEARRQADEAAQVRAEEEARVRALEEDRRKAEEDMRRRVDEEMRRHAEEEAVARAAEQSRLRAEIEARVQAEFETSRRAEDEARLAAEMEARLRAEREASRQAEEAAKRREEDEARMRSTVEMQRRAEEERLQREAEERHRLEDAQFRVEQETLMQVAAELSRRRSELEAARQNAEEEARLLVEVQQRAKLEEEARRQLELERQRLEFETERRAEEEQLAKSRRRVAEEQIQAAERARLEAEEAEGRLAELESVRQKAYEDARARAEKEQHLKTEILALIRAEEDQRNRIEAEIKRRSEAEVRLREREAQAEEALRVSEEIRLKADEQARRRAEFEARLREEEALLQAEQQAHSKAEEDARRLAAEARSRAEEEARRRAEAEARWKEEEARLQSEQVARIRAEEEANRFTAEARAMVEEEFLRRAEAEARVKEEEARLKVEQDARVRAEAEAQRIVAEARALAEEEARLRADAETLVKAEESRLQAEREARTRAEEEAQRIVEADRKKAEQEARPEPSPESLELETKATDAAPPELSWVDVNLDRDAMRGSISVAAEDEALAPIDQPSLETEQIQEPAKGLEVVFAEKGIISAEDDAGIPSDILKRLNSADAGEREIGLAEVVRVGGDDAFRCISRAFDDQSADVRNAAARALFSLESDRAATFTRALREGSPERRRNIGQALAGSGLAAEAVGNLTGESREKTYDAFSLLFLMAKAGEIKPLMQAIEDYPNAEVRIAVVKLLALSGQPEIVPAFRRLAVRGSLPAEVRSAVMEAIYQISSQARESTPSAA